MMKTVNANGMMSRGVSAPKANASFSCNHTAPMQSHHIALIMDAIIMASIIIYGANVSLFILVGYLLVLVQIISLLIYEKR